MSAVSNSKALQRLSRLNVFGIYFNAYCNTLQFKDETQLRRRVILKPINDVPHKVLLQYINKDKAKKYNKE